MSKLSGRLRLYYDKWANLTDDPVILEIVRGYKLPFKNLPEPQINCKVQEFNPEEKLFIIDELDRLMKMGAISLSEEESDQFVSPIFTVPKPDGKRRFILNLKKLNSYLHCPHFKMEDYRSVLNIMRLNMFMATIDLQDAYFHVPVHDSCKKYLKFRFNGILYHFNCIPFGCCTCPLLFTKLLKPVFEKLRTLGYQSVRYLDDFLLFGQTFELCSENVQATQNLLKSLGFTVNYQKSELLPSKVIKYLGFIFNSLEMTIQLTPNKRSLIFEFAQKCLLSKSLIIREAAKLQGYLISACPAVQYGLLYTRKLASDIQFSLESNNDNYQNRMTLSQEAVSDIHWWQSVIHKAEVSIKEDSFKKVIHTDASPFGWGCFCDNDVSHGTWSKSEELLHINALELLAIERALTIFANDEGNCNILLKVDSQVAISYINCYGGCRSELLHAIAKRIWLFCEKKDIFIKATYLESKKNVEADFASRIEVVNSDWMLKSVILSQFVIHLASQL